MLLTLPPDRRKRSLFRSPVFRKVYRKVHNVQQSGYPKKKKLCSNTYVNGRADEMGQFRHPAHKAASHLAQVATFISVFLLLPNCVHDWLRLYILMHSLQYTAVIGSSLSFSYSQHEFIGSNAKNPCRISAPLNYEQFLIFC